MEASSISAILAFAGGTKKTMNNLSFDSHSMDQAISSIWFVFKLMKYYTTFIKVIGWNIHNI
jgi:hypothetical protein